MNASPLSASSSNPRESSSEATGGAATESLPAARAKRPLIYSLTGVCFLFGGLLAMQLRSIQQVHSKEEQKRAGIVEAQELATKMKAQAAKAAGESAILSKQLNNLRLTLAKNGSLTASQVAALNAQIKDLQTVAGLTPITGRGVRLIISDNPNAAKVAQSGTTTEGWGMVHDFDLQQVVNELRLAKAEAISINGQRITGYSPIRCVGSPIMINWEVVTAPFIVDAVGDPLVMKNALEMPDGIVDSMRNNGPVTVKIETANQLKLPAAGGAPKLRVAKAIS